MITYQTRLICIILWTLFISGCGDAFIGELTVHHAIGFIDKGDEAVTLSPGTYRTELRFNESVSVFELKVTDAEKQTRTLNLSVSENVRLPEASGSFSVAATEAGQTYKISGNVFSESSKTKTTNDLEFCTVQRTITDCNGPPEARCRHMWRTVNGHQAVKYHFDNELKRLSVNITEPGTGRHLAVYRGDIGNRRKIYTYRGECAPGSY
jgi:hypothetical protein